MIDADDEDPETTQKATPPAPVASKFPSPRITRGMAQACAITETPPQSAPSTSEDVSDRAENVDPMSLGMKKTSSALKRSRPKKPVIPEPAADVKTPSKAPAKSASNTVADTPSQPTSEPGSQSVNGTTPASSTNGAATVQVGGKVEYFARVHTATGVVEVPVTVEDLSDDVEIIQKYADWMEKESVPITYHTFKSIFGFAKKG
jgi:hypothetical protein